MAKKNTKPESRSEAEDFVDYERRQYAREWQVSATHFAQTGVYRWMADRMSVTGLVLEIGCGVGESTLELARRGNRVVAVEENTACIRRARVLLERAGIETAVLSRGSVTPLGPQQHRITYSKVERVPAATVVLIEGNLLSDTHLVEYLDSIGPFDAVACWLIGAHAAMGSNKSIDFSIVKTSSDYRVLVQNDVYLHADRLLRPGGVLHIVDRSSSSAQAVLDDTRQNHQLQADITSLVVTDVEHTPYTEPQGDGSVQMIRVLPDNSHVPAEGDFSLVSVRTTKPLPG